MPAIKQMVDLDFSSVSKILNLPAPVGANDVVRLSDLQASAAAISAGLSWKDQVQIGMTTNVTLTGPGATLDGRTMVAGDRVLLMGQTNTLENGVYIWNGAAVAMTVAADCNTSAGMNNAVVIVEFGTLHANSIWRQTALLSGAINTVAQVWALFQPTVPMASTTTPGIIQIATQTIVNTGTDALQAVTAATLAGWQGQKGLAYSAAGGTSDAITGIYPLAPAALADGLNLLLGVGVTNATTAPTFAPTTGGVAQTAHPIQKYVNNVLVALAVADLSGDAMLVYSLANTCWILQNPASVGNGAGGSTYAAGAGTADVITATYANASPTLFTGYRIALGVSAPNATTTPTLNATLDTTATGAKTIKKYLNNVEVALAIGDLNGVAELSYDATNGVWILLNPGVSGSQRYYAVGGGTVDAVTASYPNVAGPLVAGMVLRFLASGLNATTTPTFAPTLADGVAQAAHTIKKYVGGLEVALVAGDLQGVCEVVYDATNTCYVLQTAANSMAKRYAVAIGDGVATSYVVTHGLNTLDVQVQAYLVATGETVNTSVLRTGVNAVSVGFNIAPAAGSVRVVVLG